MRVRGLCGLVLPGLMLGACAFGPDVGRAQSEPTLFPADNARNVNPDTHLQLSFARPPEIGASGLVRIYDAADNSLVDTLDLSIPPSPRPTGRAPEMTEADRRAEGAAAAQATYQITTIDGVDFHFFPIIVRGATATIYPHNNRLSYGHRYVVKMDAGVLKNVAGREWTFSTRAAGPPAGAPRIVVATDGSGDFNTVQGALDYLPDAARQRTTVFIRNGRYEEIVYFSGKSNITLRGEDRAKVVVGYPNNSAFNPPKGGPSRRPAFTIQDGKDIQLSTFTINNYFIGQAEALLVRGERIVIDRMTLNGSGDALTTYGSIYMTDSKLTGHGDTILGYAALFCLRCEIESTGPFTWTRTPQGSHGNVFVDARFTYLDQPLPWTVTTSDTGRKSPGVLARLPRNGPGSSAPNFPYAEMVLINARMQGVPPEGWGPIEEAPGFDSSNVRFLEFNTADMAGRPLDLSRRHKVAKLLTMKADAQTIGDYSRPEFVLAGWKPAVDPN